MGYGLRDIRGITRTIDTVVEALEDDWDDIEASHDGPLLELHQTFRESTAEIRSQTKLLRSWVQTVEDFLGG